MARIRLATRGDDAELRAVTRTGVAPGQVAAQRDAQRRMFTAEAVRTSTVGQKS